MSCRLEATYEIREDIADVLGRVGGYWDITAEPAVVKFAGWARMAMNLNAFKVTEVREEGWGHLRSGTAMCLLMCRQCK